MSPEGLPQRLVPLIRRLATNHDGERLATVRAIERVLAAENLTFHDLADHVAAPVQVVFVTRSAPESEPPRDVNWRIVIEELIDYAPITPWEYEFCTSLRSQLSKRWQLSEKQKAVLLRLKRKHLDGVAA